MGKNNPFYADIMTVSDEVTGSCHPVVVKFPDGETLRFVVECGLFQEREYEKLNNELPFCPEKIDFCLVTHVHIDHVGRLPYMVKKGFIGPIYATKDTCEFLSTALYDSLKVLSTISKRKHIKCLYSGLDVYKTIKLTKACKYKQSIQVHDRVKVTFLRNGHLVGAALILVQINYPGYEDINLLFTGDYNKENVFFDVEDIPKWILELPLTIVQESTYGDMKSSEIQQCFKENVKRSISDEKTVLALVFSLGRAQEILYELKKCKKVGNSMNKYQFILMAN